MIAAGVGWCYSGMFGSRLLLESIVMKAQLVRYGGDTTGICDGWFLPDVSSMTGVLLDGFRYDNKDCDDDGVF